MSTRPDDFEDVRTDPRMFRRVVIGSSVIAAVLVASVWGRWPAVGGLVGLHVLRTCGNMIGTARATRTPRPRIWRDGLALFNMLVNLGMAHVAGWPLPAMLYMPYQLVVMETYGIRFVHRWLVPALVTNILVAAVDGVAPFAIVSFTALSVTTWAVSSVRATMLAEALAAARDTHRELADAHAQFERSKDRLVEQQKLSAVGLLAAGIAHEINNPLAVILGFAQGMERRLEAASPLHLPVASIVRESLRCRSLVQELLAFSRTGKQTREPVDLGSLVRGTSRLLESRARMQDTRLSLDLGRDVPELSASTTELQQVIVNLGNNALDAIEQGGEVVIRSRYSGNGEVCVEVQDTGPGIPEEIRPRVFEPFFTTKEVGQGTGLGLSLAYEFVRQHGGTIDIESEVGKGTTMRVRLPLHGKHENCVPAQESSGVSSRRNESPLGGGDGGSR